MIKFLDLEDFVSLGILFKIFWSTVYHYIIICSWYSKAMRNFINFWLLFYFWTVPDLTGLFVCVSQKVFLPRSSRSTSISNHTRKRVLRKPKNAYHTSIWFRSINFILTFDFGLFFKRFLSPCAVMDIYMYEELFTHILIFFEKKKVIFSIFLILICMSGWTDSASVGMNL